MKNNIFFILFNIILIIIYIPILTSGKSVNYNNDANITSSDFLFVPLGVLSNINNNNSEVSGSKLNSESPRNVSNRKNGSTSTASQADQFSYKNLSVGLSLNLFASYGLASNTFKVIIQYKYFKN